MIMTRYKDTFKDIISREVDVLYQSIRSFHSWGPETSDVNTADLIISQDCRRA